MCDLTIDWGFVTNSIFSFSIGSFYGFTELLSRYQRFDKIWKINAGKAYILFNGAVSLIVFLLMEYGKLKITLGGYQSGNFTQVILAGTAAMLVLRSSIANIKLNDKEVQIGLAPILQVFLNVVSREYDRHDSLSVLQEVKQVMNNVNFEVAERNLPFISNYLMKSLSEEDNKQIGSKVSEISNSDVDNKAKVIALGLLLVHYTGFELLKEINSQLSELLNSSPTDVNILEELLTDYGDNS